MVIRVVDVAGAADTTEQGFALYAILADHMRQDGDPVTVSFDGVSTATSSFVNVAFVQLLDLMPFDKLRARLRVVQSSRQINDMIKSRLAREAGHKLEPA